MSITLVDPQKKQYNVTIAPYSGKDEKASYDWSESEFAPFPKLQLVGGLLCGWFVISSHPSIKFPAEITHSAYNELGKYVLTFDDLDGPSPAPRYQWTPKELT